VIAGEDVALRLGEVGIIVAQVEREGLVGEAHAGVPGPVALIRHAAGESGLLPVDAGTVFWGPSTLSQHRRRDVVFYLPDGVRPWDGRHVIRVLEFFGLAFGRRAAELDEVARSVGLE